MSRLPLIRLATYVVLLVCVALAGRRHFIPLRLPAIGTDVEWWDSFEPYYHGGATPTFLPGFAETRLSGREIVRLASDCVKTEGIDPSKLSWLRIRLATLDKRLVWVVTWDIISDPQHLPADCSAADVPSTLVGSSDWLGSSFI